MSSTPVLLSVNGVKVNQSASLYFFAFVCFSRARVCVLDRSGTKRISRCRFEPTAGWCWHYGRSNSRHFAVEQEKSLQRVSHRYLSVCLFFLFRCIAHVRLAIVYHVHVGDAVSSSVRHCAYTDFLLVNYWLGLGLRPTRFSMGARARVFQFQTLAGGARVNDFRLVVHQSK